MNSSRPRRLYFDDNNKSYYISLNNRKVKINYPKHYDWKRIKNIQLKYQIKSKRRRLPALKPKLITLSKPLTKGLVKLYPLQPFYQVQKQVEKPKTLLEILRDFHKIVFKKDYQTPPTELFNPILGYSNFGNYPLTPVKPPAKAPQETKVNLGEVNVTPISKVTPSITKTNNTDKTTTPNDLPTPNLEERKHIGNVINASFGGTDSNLNEPDTVDVDDFNNLMRDLRQEFNNADTNKDQPTTGMRKLTPTITVKRSIIQKFMNSDITNKNLQTFRRWFNDNPTLPIKKRVLGDYNIDNFTDEEFQQAGRGNNLAGNGLYNDELYLLIKAMKIKNYVPIIAGDESEVLPQFVKQGQKQFAFIQNTDNAGEEGSHWMCYYFDNTDDSPSVEVFDPLALHSFLNKETYDICKAICQKMNPEKMFLIKVNKVQRQPNSSTACGYYCLEFLHKRFNGIPFSEATGYNSVIKNEERIKKFIKKYNKYI